MTEFLQFLDAGGNVATIGLFLVAWKFDRRVFAIELKLWPEKFTRG